ncbi:hypothetical protein MNBD_CHLOROFLEXI01-5325 [hydrothermal vent metagenome]|uniref:Calx-beta domain-containing protein n=1 Tax=hydrothermal vent metagenome TaxID=652676 RepID=A0A3B0ULZ0_9ZZZZ
MNKIKHHFIILTLFILITTATSLRADIIRNNISGSMVAGGDVGADPAFQISSDGQYAVFVADKEVDGTADLYSVPVDGSAAPTKLSNALVGTGIENFAFDNTDNIVYMAQEDNLDVIELYRVALDGSGSVKINIDFVDGGGGLLLNRDVEAFQISPASNRIVYSADQDVDDRVELYAVRIVGTNTKLNDPLVADGDVRPDFKVTLDGLRVIYRADQDANGRDELFTVSIDGGTVDRLNIPLVGSQDVFDFKLSTDYVIYRADIDFSLVLELYRVPIADGVNTKLNPDLPNADQDISDEYEIYVNSADSSDEYVVYKADQDTNDMDELYSVNLPNSATNTKLSDLTIIGTDVQEFSITPNGNYVVYIADQDSNNIDELYMVLIGGGTPQKRNATLGINRDVLDFVISPDSSRIVYRADQALDEVFKLYNTPLLVVGAPTPIELTNDYTVGQEVFSNYWVSPDNGRLLFIADGQVISTQRHLYSVPLAGGAIQQVNGTLVNFGDVADFKITPDSNTVVYLADQNINSQAELFSVTETPPTVQFSNATLTVDESEPTAELTVELSAISFSESSVQYAITGGTASNGAIDYQLSSGIFTFPAGNSSQTLSIPITNDLLEETDETIIITLDTPQNSTLGGNVSITVTISDDDAPDEYNLYLPLVIR